MLMASILLSGVTQPCVPSPKLVCMIDQSHANTPLTVPCSSEACAVYAGWCSLCTTPVS